MDEERHHLHHGRGWFRSLASRGDDIKQRLARQVGDALTAVTAWFGPSGQEEDEALVDAGIKSETNGVICQAVLDDVRTMATDGGVSVPEPTVLLADVWDPATRRVEAGGPEEEILFHLRGSKNELFKIG